MREAAAGCSSISGISSGSRTCPHCFAARRDRLQAMNLEQRVLPPHVLSGVHRAPHDLAPVTRVDADVAIVGSGFARIARRARAAQARPARRARRTRPPPALRHRRVVDAARQPADRGAGGPLRSAADSRRSRSGAPGSATRPDVACGLKRGFTFFFHQPGAAVRGRRRSRAAAAGRGEPARRDRRHALVPAANSIRRSRRRREAEGAIYLDMTRLERLRQRGRVARSSKASATAGSVRITARFVIDASGPRGFLHRALGLAEAPRRWLPPTQGLYTHFEGVERWDRLRPPPEHAAVSGRRCGGASCVSRRLDLGAAVQQRHHERRRGADRSGRGRARRRRGRARRGTACWRRCRRWRISSARRAPTLPFVHAPRLAFRSARVAGPAWALLPSAAGVIDPLLSTGFPLTLLGILRLVDLLERTSPGRERDAALARVRADDAGGAGRDRTARRRAVRDDGRSAAVQAAQPALFRGRQLQRGGAPARAARAGARVPALRASGVRSRTGGLRVDCGRCRRAGPRTARARGAHRPRDRAVRHGRSSRSRAARLVSRRSPRISWRRRRSWTPRRPRSSVFWSAAACSPGRRNRRSQT